MHALARPYSLVRRGGTGLTCDDDGVALGPMPLVEAFCNPSGGQSYRVRQSWR